MTKQQLKDSIKNLEKDINILVAEKLHNRTKDLQIMVMTEDLPEILKFLKQVKRVFNYENPPPDNDYSKGFLDGIKQVESEIFDD